MITIKYYDEQVKDGQLDNLSKLLKYKLWIDITSITEEEATIIGKSFSLHPLTVEDLHSSNARIKVEQFSNYMFCVFYGIKKTKKKLKVVECDFIIGENFIVSNSAEPLDSNENLKKNGKKLETLFKNGSEFIFHKLLDNEVDNYFPILEELDDELEDIEEEIIKKPQPKYLAKILNLKKSMRQTKRIGFQQRDKISFLAKNEYPFISKKAVPYFRDIYDHSIRVSDSIDNYREAISETFDAYMSAMSNNMNEVMKVLSIFATIALPMTVISGIYGTNFAILPGSKNPFGFWIMIIVMIVFVIVMINMFKKKKWF